MSARHVLVVGGTRGIGRVVVRTFSRKGFVTSVIGGHPPDDEDRDIKNAHYWINDLTDRGAITEILSKAVRQHGKLRTVVFLQRYRGEEDDWAGELDVTLNCTRHVIDQLSDEFADCPERSIVIVSSVAALTISEEQPLGYHVAKAGLNQMIRYYAVALGPKGVRVNGVSPCAIAKNESKDFYLKNPEVEDLLKSITPLARMGTSEEVSEVVDFLAGSQAGFVTGQNIIVDGGMSLRFPDSLARNWSNIRKP